MAAPTFVASYSPSSDWTTGTTPKTDSVTANSNDVLVLFGGTEDSSSATLGTPSDGSNTYTLQESETVASLCSSYAWTTVIGAAAPLSVTTTSLPGAIAGSSYSQTLAATGGTGSGYVWTVPNGTLPAWASLSSSGVISGTPSGTGSSTFTVQVVDSAFDTATRSLSISTSNSLSPSGPSGSWTLAWNDEFDDSGGMSGPTHGLNPGKWNVGNYFGPSSPGGSGYTGKSKTASDGAGAIEFYGPGSLSFPGSSLMSMSNYASGSGPDGSYTIGSFSSNSEGAGVNTAGLMNITCNTGYSVPSGIASTVIQAANIVIEAKIKWAGPCTDGSYWDWFGTYNCGDCSTPGYPNSGQWTEEIDWWEELGSTSKGSSFAIHMHPTLTYNGPTSVPSSLGSTDLSLAFHTYTVQMTYSTIQMWVDGTAVTGITPTTAEMQAQWATPQYIGLMHQLRSGYTLVTGVSGVTPMQVDYVRVFTQ